MLILTTKMMLPRRGRGVLPRPRLDRLASEVAEHKATVVKAPPGYGKTTLGRTWADELASQGARVAWLSTDSADADPSRLAIYIVAALHRTCPSIGRAGMELSSTSATWKPETILSLLLNDLCDHAEEVFLFVDDYHHVVGTASEAVLSMLLKRAPSNLHLVLLGRCNPPDLFAEAFVHNEAMVVDASALRFSLDETLQLVQRSHPEQRLEDARLLQDISNGWAAALRVLMLSAAHHESPKRYLQRVAASNRPLNTLITDLLDQLMPELTDFMMRIALTERTCGSLAHAITDRDDAHQRIEQIESLQLFLAPLDDERHWFAFHPLFRENLERRFAERHPAEVAGLHRRAAIWYAQRRHWRSAVSHAVQGGDTPLALQWIEQCAMSLVELGDMLTLIAWDRQLRNLRVANPLKLRLALAWAYALGMECEEARRLMADAKAEIENLSKDPRERQALLWQCKVLESMLLVFEDRTHAGMQLATQALTEQHHDQWITYVMLNVLAFGYGRGGQWQLFYAMPTYAEQVPGNERYIFNLAYRHCVRGMAKRGLGLLDKAEELFRAALKLDTDGRDTTTSQAVPTSHTVMRSLAQSGLSEVLYERNQLSAAATMATECLPTIRISGPLDFVAAAALTQIRLVRLDNDKRRWRTLLDETEAWALHRGWERLVAFVLMERLRGALLDRHEAEAGALVSRLEALAKRNDLDSHALTDIGHMATLARAWSLLSCGAPDRLAELAEAAYDNASKAGLSFVTSRLGIALALSHALKGETSLARAVLLGALTPLVKERALRTVLDTPVQRRLLTQLLRELAQETPLQPELGQYLQSALLALTRGEPCDLAGSSRLAALLSSRERQIMRLVVDGCSNKQIAKALGLAPDTVKYHLKSTFTKLGVEGRTQAAAMAHQLQLVNDTVAMGSNAMEDVAEPRDSLKDRALSP